MNSNYRDPRPAKPAPNRGAAALPEAEEAETPIAIDGFQQVLEMLQAADPQFRESLLRRMATRDRALVAALRRELGM